MKYDFSVIICATNLVEAYSVCENIELTSGCKCLFLIHDNTRIRYSLAHVYNMYSKIALADNILLVHQDVEFIGKDWGQIIINKLQEKDCGAIGFAGSVYRPKDYYCGWTINKHLARCNYSHKSKSILHHEHINNDFDLVCVLDGLALFVKKDIVLKHPFDELLLTGFHCYDIDFSLVLHSLGLKNYVITDKNKLTVFHKSIGNFDKEWTRLTFKLASGKWNKLLPVSVDNISLNQNDYQCIAKENQMYIRHIQKLLSTEELIKILSQLPFKLDSFINLALYNNGYTDWN